MGLRAKMYSVKSPNHEKKAAKGVSAHVRNNCISHEDYKNCLFMETEKSDLQVRIGHNAHQLNTISQNKISLSPYNDKRWISKNSDLKFEYLSFGHKKLRTNTHPK